VRPKCAAYINAEVPSDCNRSGFAPLARASSVCLSSFCEDSSSSDSLAKAAGVCRKQANSKKGRKGLKFMTIGSGLLLFLIQGCVDSQAYIVLFITSFMT
jgi:hypothetical protein